MSSTSSALVSAAAVALALVLIAPLLRLWLRRRGQVSVARELALLRWPGRSLAAALFARIAVEGVDHDRWMVAIISALIVCTTLWVLARSLLVAQHVVLHRLRLDVVDNLRARSRITKIELLRRITTVVLGLGALFALLVTLTPISRYGTTLVAYAGIIGVVLGLALRTPLENLVAGLLVALTAPIRIDDVVVVEAEWGRIEQIGLVNVVVRLWDERRLVLPTSYFVSTPFENWTRETSSVIGTVFVWTDFEADVDGIRREFERIVRAAPEWDGRVVNLQVVDLAERGVQLRGIASAPTANAAWDLRCRVREDLLPHLAATPRALPRLRGESPLVA